MADRDETDSMKCDFCGFESDEPGWIRPSDRPMHVDRLPDGPNFCEFCQKSEAAYWYFNGAGASSAERDQMMVANMMREMMFQQMMPPNVAPIEKKLPKKVVTQPKPTRKSDLKYNPDCPKGQKECEISELDASRSKLRFRKELCEQCFKEAK